MLRKIALFASICTLYSFTTAADTLPGGDPKESRAASKSVFLYVVTKENLDHPQQLKAYFEHRCEGITPVCMIQFWQNASQVPQANPMDMSDTQLNARAGIYIRNTSTSHNKLQLEKDGNVTQEF